MEVMDAILRRRTIRKFIDKDIEKDILLKILKAGASAPSPKNKQPWKFVVLTDKGKREMINIIRTGMEAVVAEYGSLINSETFLSSTESGLKIIAEAPVTVVIINTENKNKLKYTPVKKYLEMANVLSAGAAIENMLLAALEHGIGGVLISDIYYTQQELGQWLNTDRQIVASLSLGYPAEEPPAITRKELDSIVEWKS